MSGIPRPPFHPACHSLETLRLQPVDLTYLSLVIHARPVSLLLSPALLLRRLTVPASISGGIGNSKYNHLLEHIFKKPLVLVAILVSIDTLTKLRSIPFQLTFSTSSIIPRNSQYILNTSARASMASTIDIFGSICHASSALWTAALTDARSRWRPSNCALKSCMLEPPGRGEPWVASTESGGSAAMITSAISILRFKPKEASSRSSLRRMSWSSRWIARHPRSSATFEVPGTWSRDDISKLLLWCGLTVSALRL